MANATTDPRTEPAFTREYSPRMKALCDLAISIIEDVHEQGVAKRVGRHPTLSEDALMDAVGQRSPGLSVAVWRDLASLFADLSQYARYEMAFLEGFEAGVGAAARPTPEEQLRAAEALGLAD